MQTRTSRPQTGADKTAPVAKPQQEETVPIDALFALLHSRVAFYYIKQIKGATSGMLAENQLQGAIKGAYGQLLRMDDLIDQQLPPNIQEWFIKAPTKDILFNIGSLTELCIKIGMEEDDRYYQEFLMMVVGLLNDLFYSKQQRSKVHFPKYKKLISFIGEELKHDAAGEEGRLRYEDGKLQFYINNLKPEEVHP